MTRRAVAAVTLKAKGLEARPRSMIISSHAMALRQLLEVPPPSPPSAMVPPLVPATGNVPNRLKLSSTDSSLGPEDRECFSEEWSNSCRAERKVYIYAKEKRKDGKETRQMQRAKYTAT